MGECRKKRKKERDKMRENEGESWPKGGEREAAAQKNQKILEPSPSSSSSSIQSIPSQSPVQSIFISTSISLIIIYEFCHLLPGARPHSPPRLAS
ncbi:hypothetical protein M747DRAFT_37095 [Aspergillus niger ATCC 13496]|uniref:Uncharacterized protein n=1 Tax=Aspergillus niger ATCC 13496 TaxID=1353008 RepID=A0A370C129_ASPNG|nr:hypothetical protein M747DRAFT_37095 [Aspergillus niger ATCC 13496]